MINMSPHPYSNGEKHQAFVDIQVLPHTLIANFNVISNALHINDKFNSMGWANDKLWDFDVVELFLTRDSENKKYLELQISPLNQKLALLIKKPRVEVEEYLPTLSEAFASITEQGFKAQFKVSHSDIPGEADIIKGNAHACLGNDPQSYYSLHKGDSGVPDFHKPQFFKKLGHI